MTIELSGRTGLLTVSDPWDFAHNDGSTVFVVHFTGQEGSPKATGLDVVSVRLDEPISTGGTTWEYFIATPRGDHQLLEPLHLGKQVTCNLVSVTGADLEGSLREAVARWRGGLAAIGTLAISP